MGALILGVQFYTIESKFKNQIKIKTRYNCWLFCWPALTHCAILTVRFA